MSGSKAVLFIDGATCEAKMPRVSWDFLANMGVVLKWFGLVPEHQPGSVDVRNAEEVQYTLLLGAGRCKLTVF
jgi:hypothetical protein